MLSMLLREQYKLDQESVLLLGLWIWVRWISDDRSFLCGCDHGAVEAFTCSYSSATSQKALVEMISLMLSLLFVNDIMFPLKIATIEKIIIKQALFINLHEEEKHATDIWPSLCWNIPGWMDTRVMMSLLPTSTIATDGVASLSFSPEWYHFWCDDLHALQ